MKYSSAVRIGLMLAEARTAAGLSQREMSERMGIGRKTVQSWEAGDSSPDSDEIFDWFAVCGASPLVGFLKIIHPELYTLKDMEKTEEQIDAELALLTGELPIQTKRLLLFILKGKHGSFPPAVISEIAANLHCPLNNRVSVCGAIIDHYTYAQAQGLDPCPECPQPIIEDLKINYVAGRNASQAGAQGYVGQRVLLQREEDLEKED